MTTSIGRSLTGPGGGAAVASLVGAAVVATDLAFARWGGFPLNSDGRYTLALVSFAVTVRLARGDLASVGLRLSPVQGWRPWIAAGLWMGVAVGLLVALGWGAWLLSGRPLPDYATPPPPNHLGSRFLGMCVFAPALEEILYRLTPCVPFAAAFGPRAAIVLSGAAFGLLHVVYGNPSPENLIGGFILAWAFLKSESFALPVLLHAIGNLCALGSQVAGWYWITGAA